MQTKHTTNLFQIYQRHQFHQSSKHQSRRAAKPTDQQVIGGQEQSAHAWRWASRNSTAASAEESHKRNAPQTQTVFYFKKMSGDITEMWRQRTLFYKPDFN